MLTIECNELVKRINKIVEIKTSHLDIKKNYTQDGPTPDNLTRYIACVMKVLSDYINQHGRSYGKDKKMVVIDYASLKCIEWNRSKSESDTLEDCCSIMLGLLSDDFGNVLDALLWCNHLLHLTGRNGTIRSYHEYQEIIKKRGYELSGFLLVDHGKYYGIDYELINKISEHGIDTVYPEVYNFF